MSTEGLALMRPKTGSAIATPERRMFSRRTCDDGSIRVIVFLGPETCTATVLDISAGGMGLLLDAIVAPSDRLNIEFRNPALGAWYCKTLQVAHAAPAQGGRWLVGGAFNQPLSLEEFRQLLPPRHGS